MPRSPTYPTLYDECKTIGISEFLRWGYLKAQFSSSGTLTWKRGDEITGSISFRLCTNCDSPYLELDYRFNDKPIKYRVHLITVSSNLGKGVYWFFICPHTGKRCRKLHLVNGYFYHRTSFSGCMYEKQTYSAWKRQMDRAFALLFDSGELYEQLHSKHFKEYYRGQPTKRYKKIWGKLIAASHIKEEDILKRYR